MVLIRRLYWLVIPMLVFAYQSEGVCSDSQASGEPELAILASLPNPTVGVEGTAENFAFEVLAASMRELVIVDFWAVWCSPCLRLNEILSRIVAERAGRLRLVTVNYDNEPALADQFSVDSLPVVILYRDGRLVAEFRRERSEAQVREFLAEYLL